jgi:type 1 glutamine amidotransferase
LPAEQLATLRRHVAMGKGVVGVRTASHAFAPRDDGPVSEGRQQWLEFDRDVLGGNYHGHYGNKRDEGGPTMVGALPEARRHPVLAGVSSDEFAVSSWLYKTSPLAETATPLMVGRIAGREASEPVAWTNISGKSRVFYTSLGHPDDFELPEFTQLLENGIRWAAVGNSDSTAGAGLAPPRRD